MDKERKKIDLEPKTMEEKKMKEVFEQWYHSREFVPHGVMIMNLCYLGFKQGVEYMRQQIRLACEFYLKYKDDPGLLIKDYPEYKKEMEERNKEFLSVTENLRQSLIPDVVKGLVLSFKDKEYNEWLFKEAFRSVLEGEGNEK